jgi:hypothetical protein
MGQGEAVEHLPPLRQQLESRGLGDNPIIPLSADALHLIGTVLDGGEIAGLEWRLVEIGINAVVEVHAWEGRENTARNHARVCLACSRWSKSVSVSSGRRNSSSCR